MVGILGEAGNLWSILLNLSQIVALSADVTKAGVFTLKTFIYYVVTLQYVHAYSFRESILR